MADLLRIATSGLLAYQGALNTTGHNIANASVEGFSRQRAEFATLPGRELNGLVFGNGVEVEAVSRLVDRFVTGQLRTDTSVYQRARIFASYGEQLDSLFADASIGISDRIDDFFAALGDAASDPQSLALRGLVLDSAAALGDRFNALYARLAGIDAALNTRLDALAGEVSTLAQGVARLNAEIGMRVGSQGATGQQPNDLLDERDRLVLQLSALVDVQVVADGSALNLYLGKGQALVTGSSATAAVAVEDPLDPSRRQLALRIGGATAIVSQSTTGGEVGGLLAFREQMLDPAFNSLGRIALAFSADVNAQNALGVDLEGDLGGAVFSDPDERLAAALRARPAADNDPASTGGVRVFITEPAQLTTSDYRLDIGAGGSWRLLRLQDGTLAASGSSLADTLVSVDGFTLDLNLSELPPGNFVDGDRFLIQPTRRGAQSMRTVMTRPEDLALAGAVRASASAGNIGTGTLGEVRTLDTTTAAFATPGVLSPPLLVRFRSATRYDILDADTLAVLHSGLEFTPGASNTLFGGDASAPAWYGLQVTLAGSPAAGDSFRIDYNAGAVADNRNARLMSALQSADTVAGGRIGYQQAYNLLVSGVGSTTRSARVDAESGLTVLEQTQDRREQLSGVNLDEEAANLIRFEQAYNASAQVIAVARTVLDALFDAIG